ncbi:MAG TPA: zf-HC2 domain-containing protein [Candidatus Acidoferrales bacterium]|nr:zf-HC2 domain-containing protein [Candidatus Acidoferrales bacterium]
MNWNCAITEERLGDVLDGTLARSDLAAFSAHAAGCSRCAQLVAQVGGVVQRVRQLPQIDEPPFLASKIIAATRGPSARERSAKGWLPWLPAVWPARVAMGAVTVAASFLIVFHAVGALPRKMALNPVSLYHEANRHVHLTYARGEKFVNDLRVVYVIQSRLFSEPRPVSEPAPAPASQPTATPEQHPPDSDARPKSQAAPPTGHRTTQITTELAMLMVSGRPLSPLNEFSRSYL